MKTLKKIFLKGMLALMLGFMTINSLSLVNAQYNPATQFGQTTSAGGIAVIDAGTEGSSKLIDVVKRFVNWVLGILALIALVVLLWGGFQMVIAAGDEDKYKKGFTILKQAAIGLAFIALAWLFVSLVFWLIGIVTT